MIAYIFIPATLAACQAVNSLDRLLNFSTGSLVDGWLIFSTATLIFSTGRLIFSTATLNFSTATRLIYWSTWVFRSGTDEQIEQIEQ